MIDNAEKKRPSPKHTHTHVDGTRVDKTRESRKTGGREKLLAQQHKHNNDGRNRRDHVLEGMGFLGALGPGVAVVGP